MKAAPFAYFRPSSLDAALACLAERGEEARLLAGGQSLLPLLHMRLTHTQVLIDITRLDELRGIQVEGDWLRIGALTQHEVALQSPLVQRHAPLLSQALPHVAHFAVRQRGTFGGSVALADPSAEIPAVCLTLGAEFDIASPEGHRRVAAESFFLGPYTTILAPDEILVAAYLPLADASDWFGFVEQSRRQGDYAIVGVCCALRQNRGEIERARVGAFGIGGRPQLLVGVNAALEGAIALVEIVVRNGACLRALQC